MASTDTGAPIIGSATIDSCEGVDLLSLEVNAGNGTVIDAYLNEAGGDYLIWKLALTLSTLKYRAGKTKEGDELYALSEKYLDKTS